MVSTISPQEDYMISRKLTDLIRSNTANLTQEWAKRVKQSPNMKAYGKLSEEELKKRNQRFFENLVHWLDEGASHGSIKSYFARIGRERFHEPIPLEEVNFSIIIAKKVLWDFILSENLLSSALEIYQALEMLTVIYNFFDFGFLHIGREYYDELYDKLDSLPGVNAAEVLPARAGISDKELESLFGIRLKMQT